MLLFSDVGVTTARLPDTWYTQVASAVHHDRYPGRSVSSINLTFEYCMWIRLLQFTVTDLYMSSQRQQQKEILVLEK